MVDLSGLEVPTEVTSKEEELMEVVMEDLINIELDRMIIKYNVQMVNVVFVVEVLI